MYVELEVGKYRLPIKYDQEPPELRWLQFT